MMENGKTQSISQENLDAILNLLGERLAFRLPYEVRRGLI
jgi:hypothetical protein